jgi:signal transduction histidine kinase
VRTLAEGVAVDPSTSSSRRGDAVSGWNLGVVAGLAAIFLLICLAHVLMASGDLAWPGAATVSMRAFAGAIALLGSGLAWVRFAARGAPMTLLLASSLGTAGLFMVVRTVITLIGYSDESLTFLFAVSIRTAWAQDVAFALVLLAGVVILSRTGGARLRGAHALVIAGFAAAVSAAGVIGAWSPGFPGNVLAGSLLARPDYAWTAALHLILLVVLVQRDDVRTVPEGRWLMLALYVSFLNQVLVLPFWPAHAPAAASALGSGVHVVVYAIICVGLLVGTFTAERAEVRSREESRRLTEEHARVEAALARQAARLEHANEELAQYASVASHDLQEPLRMVTSYLQLIERRYDDVLDDDGREFMRYAVDGAARMKRLTNDLLDYSKVSGALLEPREVDLGDVLRSTLANLETVVVESEAEVTWEALPSVTADATQVAQVFQNLVGNALKFRRPGVPPRVHVSARREGPEWSISVQDNGIGIEERHAGKLFTLFQRLHREEVFPGTGIGLALCRKIVERHGGRIWFESVPGRGTTFHFTLPLAAPAPRPSTDDGEDPVVRERVATLIDRARELI